ncbi:MAG: ATP-binding protein [Bacteroidota bacterium]
MAAPTTLRVAGQTSELARVRKAVSAWSAQAGLDEARTRRLQLAVDEAVANAIEHGMTDTKRGRITIGGAIQNGEVTVTVRYRGDRFDPTAAPTRPAADSIRQRAEHGYGLHLMRGLVDAAAYRYAKGINEVQLTKRQA